MSKDLEKTITYASLIGATLFLFVIFCISFIRPGEVGVVVNLFGDSKDNKELDVGIRFTLPWQTVYKFPTYEQNHSWTDGDAFHFQTSEGLTVQANIGITYNLIPEKIPVLFAKYRKGLEEITHVFIKNCLRNAVNTYASQMNIEDLYGLKKEEFFKKVHAHATSELKDFGFNITHVFIIGEFIVPDLVKEALNKKIEAIQRAQQRENELREAKAQAEKEIAIAEGQGKSKIIAAKASADANNIISNSITPNLIKWTFIDKWDGKLPTAVSGETMNLLFDIKH